MGQWWFMIPYDHLNPLLSLLLRARTCLTLGQEKVPITMPFIMCIWVGFTPPASMTQQPCWIKTTSENKLKKWTWESLRHFRSSERHLDKKVSHFNRQYKFATNQPIVVEFDDFSISPTRCKLEKKLWGTPWGTVMWSTPSLVGLYRALDYPLVK